MANAVGHSAHVEEVRVAMALNGGVSLAVWMGGCAVELDCARRAHLGPEDAGTAERPAPREVYRAVCGAFEREFVVDIMSGASAGGINGALLAGTMRAGRRLPPELLRRKWLDLGNFGRLLYGINDPGPTSIMRGGLFRDDLEGMFAAVLGTDKAGEDELAQTNPPATQQGLEPYPALLDVTMTNVEGEPRSFVDDWNGELSAREYRSLFRFRTADDFTATTLADAARTSASFPVAFEPFFVDGASAALAGVPASRWAIDGGLLENAPIDTVLRLIPTRPAARRVRRFVCYVNADPPHHDVVDDDLPPPTLQQVLGFVVNIPRNARFVDQLAAIEQAKRRATFSRENQLSLLTLDMESLWSTARALLEPYRRRRFLLSLEAILDNPGQARLVFGRLGAHRGIPWIPTMLDAPLKPRDWHWGMRPAERVLYLQLDVLREALADARDEAVRERLLDARVWIDEQIRELEALGRQFAGNASIRSLVAGLVDDPDPEAEIAALAELTAEYNEPLLAAVRTGTEALYAVARDLGTAADGAKVAAALFGDDVAAGGPLTDSMFTHFLSRALAIEVVRRAFSAEEEIDTAQELRFAQLTPLAPSWIFTATPLRERGPDSPEKKLTGIRLGHFAGFYRRAWRANDFMWGRLDAATRIVDMLVEGVRAREVADAGRAVPWAALAQALVPDGDETVAREQRWLVHEALVDARAAAPDLAPAVNEALADYPAEGEAPEPAELRAALERALEADLRNDDKALLTRVVCARAAQLEIVRQELPVVVAESRGDRELGCYTKPLTLEVDDAVGPAIEQLRTSRLPLLLGRDSPDEAASNLALGTVAHASFVGLATLRTAGLPLSRALAVVRAPLLPLAGIASRRWWVRLSVLVGFAAAAFYIAARIVSATGEEAPLGSLWSPPVWLGVLSLLALAGVVMVPGLRAMRSESLRWRIEQGLWALALLAAGGAVVVALGKIAGGLGLADLLVTPGADEPHEAIVWIALGVVLGLQALRLPWLPAPLAKVATGLLQKVPLSWLVIVAAGATFVWSGPELWDAIRADELWVQAAAVCAAASVPVCLLYLVVGNRR